MSPSLPSILLPRSLPVPSLYVLLRSNFGVADLPVAPSTGLSATAGVVKTCAPPSRWVISAVTFPVGAAVPLAAVTVAWIGTGWVNMIEPYCGPSTAMVVASAGRGWKVTCWV